MQAFENTPFEALFLKGVKGELFGLHFPAIGPVKGRLLCVPPFAEESNRCRVMMGMGARALAHAGWSTLVLDLYGCGDSEGDFHEATWEIWQQDIETGIDWLRSRPGEPPLVLWGIRLSAIQVAQASLRRKEEVSRLLFWQPVINSKQMFTQYLRLRVANSLDVSGRQETTKELRERLANGETLEIGGYYISPRLSHDLDHASMEPVVGPRIDWLERIDENKTELNKGIQKSIDAWREDGANLHVTTFRGPPFWQLHERFLAPELIEATLCAMETGQ